MVFIVGELRATVLVSYMKIQIKDSISKHFFDRVPISRIVKYKIYVYIIMIMKST